MINRRWPVAGSASFIYNAAKRAQGRSDIAECGFYPILAFDMSGPTTVIITAEPISVLLAAAAIRAAEAVREGYQEAARLHDAHAASGEQNRAAQSAASAAGQKALADAVDRAEQRFSRLCELAKPLGLTTPVIDSQRRQSPQEIAAYIEQLETQCLALEKSLFSELGEAATPVEQGLVSPLAPEEAQPPVAPPTTTARLLARLAALGPLPESIEALRREIAATTDVDRAELIGIELRRAIQHFEEQATREASALVLEQTLKDLGYQVESVTDTLFVEGGVVHFRRQGWGDYQVRMRLNAKENSANFNVVRAVDAGNNERSVLDHIAEDRWCAEFPALLQALAKRGLHLEVTRRLEAGELPVQLVDRNKLPCFAEEESSTRTSAPLHKEMQ